MRTTPELTCLTTCPLCSQRHDLTIDDLRPMTPWKWQIGSNGSVVVEMVCIVCGVVCPLPGKGEQ